MKALALDPDLRYQDAGSMGRDLEAFAAKKGISIGHGAIVEQMHLLFEATPPGGRRRFPRASSDMDRTPVEPIDCVGLDDDEDEDASTDPTQAALTAEEAPTSPVEPVTPAHPRAALPPAPSEAVTMISVPPPAPLVIRIGTPAPIPRERSGTGTDKVHPYRRMIPSVPSPHWWWPMAVLALTTAIAIALAVRG